MQTVKYKRKSLVFARGFYDHAGYDAKVYQITKNGVAEWAWEGCNNPLPPGSWPLREVRQRCLLRAKVLAANYDAFNAGVKRRPKLCLIKRKLTKLKFAFLCGDYRLLEKAISVFDSYQTAAEWLTRSAPQLNGAVPGLLAKTQSGWWRVFNALVRIEFAKYKLDLTTT